MPHLVFTAALQRHVPCPPRDATGATVREILENAFADNPRARLYVLDEQGGLRRHMVVFVDGEAIRDRTGLSDRVESGSQVYVMQALSGG